MAMTDAWFDEAFFGVSVPGDVRGLTEKVCRYYWLDEQEVPRVIASMAAVEFSCGDGEGGFFGPMLADEDACARLAGRILSQYGEKIPRPARPQQWLSDLLSRITRGEETMLDRFRFARAEQPRATWDDREVFFSVSQSQVIDVITADGRGQYGGSTLAGLLERYPDGRLMMLTDAAELSERARIDPTVREIPAEALQQAMEILPPEDLVIQGERMTFKCSEHLSGRVTGIYAKIDGACYMFRDVCSLRHDEIVERVQAAVRTEQVVPTYVEPRSASSSGLSM